jgi:hypothetical protein
MSRRQGLLDSPISEENRRIVEAYTAQNEALVDAYLATLPQRGPNDDIILGSGEYTYRVVNGWAKLPEGWAFLDVPAVAIDAQDRVYVFNRGDHPVMIFDRQGNLLDHWGEGLFKRAHGIHIGPDGMIYLADDGNHCVHKCTPQGKILLTLGMPGKPAPFMSGDPFCRCTDVALSPKGEIYVSDGYFNARIHKYSPDGKLLLSWGGPGTLPGEFNIPHNVVCDADGWVYVADRENHRVQVFDANGKYETQWNNMHRANSLELHGGKNKLFYLGESGPHLAANRHMPNCGPRISIMTPKGELVARLGTLPSGDAPDRFLSMHGIAVDSHDDIYLSENAYSGWLDAFPDRPAPQTLRSLRKLIKVPAPAS